MPFGDASRTVVVLRRKERFWAAGILLPMLVFFVGGDVRSMWSHRVARLIAIARAGWVPLVVAATFLVVVPIALVALLVWILFSREEIVIDGSNVSMQVKLGPFAASSMRRFPLGELAGICLVDERRRRRGYSYTVHRLQLVGEAWAARTHFTVSRVEACRLLAGPLRHFAGAS